MVGTWISEVERERQKLQRQLSVRPKNQSMTTTEIRDLVEQLRDIVGVLANASPADRRAVYDELGVSLTYHPETKSIEVRGRSTSCTPGWCRRGEFNPKYTRPLERQAGGCVSASPGQHALRTGAP